MNDSLFAISEMICDYRFISKSMIMEEPSMAQRLERHLKKLFVLSCASYYETQITNGLKIYAISHSKKYNLSPHGFDYLETFSFFKMFDFGRTEPKKPNAFLTPLKVFGITFKSSILSEVTSDVKLEQQMYAFQEMCSLRNSLAHNDLISTDDAIEAKTFSDVEQIHKEAIVFVNYLLSKFPIET